MTEIPKADFHDRRIDMAHWYPKLRDIDVPTPKTQPLALERTEGESPTWDTKSACEIVEKLGGSAFARSGYKSAQMSLYEGSHIRDNSEKTINQTLRELVSQHAMMQMPLGESLWLRELLDVNWSNYARENLCPEVRAFIRDGEVVCHHPRLEGFSDHPDEEEAAEQIIEQAWPREIEYGQRDHEALVVYAERVAEEFDGWWSVDFVMDTSGKWWCTDMAIDALYERDGNVRGMSQHPDDCNHNIEVMNSD